MKKIIMVKADYLCMGQKMMWDNVVSLSLNLWIHILCE
jgi:hypothetical protein